MKKPSAEKRRTGRRDAPHPGRSIKKLERDGATRNDGRRIDRGDGQSWPAKRIGAKDLFVPKPPAICYLYQDLADAVEPMPVFGQYPRGLIGKLLPWLRCARSEILHVCSGSLPRGEGIRVDLRPEARPDVVADGRALPFADGSIAAVMLDPPYTPHYARELYGTEYPRPSHLLREAARVVRPGGRICFVHYIQPNPPPGCRFVKAFGLGMGFGFPMRAATLYEREQAQLPGVR